MYRNGSPFRLCSDSHGLFLNMTSLCQVLVMSIYAILGVEFFMNYGENGSYTNELGEVVEITTARDLQYGFFGLNLLKIWVWLKNDRQPICWMMGRRTFPT